MRANKMSIKEIPVPPKTIMVTFERDNGVYESRHEMFFEPEQFLEFFEPLVNYYEGVKNDSNGS